MVQFFTERCFQTDFNYNNCNWFQNYTCLRCHSKMTSPGQREGVQKTSDKKLQRAEGFMQIVTTSPPKQIRYRFLFFVCFWSAHSSWALAFRWSYHSKHWNESAQPGKIKPDLHLVKSVLFWIRMPLSCWWILW